MKVPLRSSPLVEKSGEVIQKIEHRPTLNLTLTGVAAIQGLSECVYLQGRARVGVRAGNTVILLQTLTSLDSCSGAFTRHLAAC